MTERIFKNWKTSFIGVLIIIVAGMSVYLDKASLTEAGAFLVLGLGLFFSKDGRKEK